MIRHFLALLCVPLAAGAAPAAAHDVYSVSNGTNRSFSCGLRWEPRRHTDIFVLVRGRTVARPARGGGDRRTLLCDSQPRRLQRFIVRPGTRYQLVQREGVVWIRDLGPTE
jgi:hypothetical protein